MHISRRLKTHNFKLEQVMAVVVQTNAGRLQGQAVKLACNFEEKTPQIGPATAGNGIG